MRIAIPMMTSLAAAGLLAGCASTPTAAPVEVTRYSVDNVERGTISIVPANMGDIDPVSFRSYEAALTSALTAQGYTVLPDGKQGAMIATVAINNERSASSRRSPVSIGLGGGGFSGDRGGGVGLGGGVSFPIGGGRPREAVRTTLSVKIDKRDGAGVWEGRAVTQAIRPVGTSDDALAARLVHGLFTGFPGESGRTIEVK